MVFQTLVAALPLTGAVNTYEYAGFGCDFMLNAPDAGGRFHAYFRTVQGKTVLQFSHTSPDRDPELEAMMFTVSELFCCR